jgi:hypothetical protein
MDEEVMSEKGDAVGAEEKEAEEGVRPKVRKSPEMPSQEEIDEHNIGHGTFRAWCPHCVRGRGVSHGRKKGDGSEREIPAVAIDNMYMREKQEKEEENGMPTLVVRDSETKMTWAHVVPAKGRDGYAIERLRRDVALLGHKKIAFKRDGEKAIVALKEAVQLVSGVSMTHEESPVGDHRANGLIDNAVQQAQGQVRVMKDALESRIQSKIKGDHPCLPWLVRHAACIINRRRKDDMEVTPKVEGERLQDTRGGVR